MSKPRTVTYLVLLPVGAIEDHLSARPRGEGRTGEVVQVGRRGPAVRGPGAQEAPAR